MGLAWDGARNFIMILLSYQKFGNCNKTVI